RRDDEAQARVEGPGEALRARLRRAILAAHQAGERGLRLRFSGRHRAYARPGDPLGREGLRALQVLLRELPVRDLPERIEVLCAVAGVVDVVGVLPYTAGEQRLVARAQRRVGVARARHREAAVAHPDEPGPPRAELLDGRPGERLAERIDAAEALFHA